MALIAHDVASALNFLHHNEVIYRDLKCENVMMDITGQVKLSRRTQALTR
jgi:serum/glucocorticoid-regulated kinase 2